MNGRKTSLLFKSMGLAVAIGLALFFVFQYAGQASSAGQVLARVDLEGRNLAELALPVYAHLQDGAGEDYALVVATEEGLEASGYPYEVIDEEYQAGNVYYLARPKKVSAYTRIPSTILKLYWDGKYALILNPTVGEINKLGELGFGLKRLSSAPMVLTAPSAEALIGEEGALRAPAETGAFDVRGGQGVYDFICSLSGVNAVKFNDGTTYTIKTRRTGSGTPIQKATQYAYEWFKRNNQMTSVEYHSWSASGYSGRNVVAEKVGSTKPKEIVLVVAHLDDMPTGATAPGADDNASGSGAVLYLSGFVSNAPKRTVRLVLFTGEEQGLLGSAAYAQKVADELAQDSQKKVVAVFNMDMIAYDNLNGPVVALHTRPTNNPGYAADKAIADLFISAVNQLDLDLEPTIQADGESASDHSSFWDQGFPAILVIEDFDNDATPYYHKVGDTASTLNRPYLTAINRAAVETVKKLMNP